ncbi:MAG: DUF975 domain-containing protein [Nostoc sp.]|uniref:DUF975 domain-containing protein n=1 Tax=Nostoc sp. TaxID=1180 RepID=UPI002FFC6236
MSENFGSPSPIQPLSIGNVVSAGMRLYRSHLKLYLKLALTAYVWALLPIYGWAKCASILAIISRLAFGELVNQPESIEESRRVVNSRLWQFLILGLIMFAVGIGLIAILVIPFSFFIGITISYFATNTAVGNNLNPTFIVIGLLLTIIFFPVLLTFLLLLQARFFVVDLPLAIEDDVDGVSTISRSWDLTKRQGWRIVGILFIGYLITLPIQLPFSIVSSIIQSYLKPLSKENITYAILSAFVSIVLTILSATLVVPFWQAIKAVIYYDLRSRREGLGLKLRDREI